MCNIFFQDHWIVSGYKGVVASNIQCDSKSDLAISVAVGNKLFNHIVTTAKVATRILYWKNKLEIRGEFNFIPLDKILVNEFDYPKSKNIKPLLQMIEYPQELTRAFQVIYLFFFSHNFLYILSSFFYHYSMCFFEKCSLDILMFSKKFKAMRLMW